jgi:hypothetical protein
MVVISDLHCGHEVGLTPPDWQFNIHSRDLRRKALATQQFQTYDWYQRRIKELSPIDCLVVNGDATDGKGTKSGGTELITADMLEQAKMAAVCINEWKAPKTFLTYGTPYHVGATQDFEDAIVPLVDGVCNIEPQQFLDLNGVVFDIKHFVGASSIPHGRFTALAKDKLWNTVWNAEHDNQPEADVLIRSHVHYHGYCGSSNNWMAMTTPALQGFGGKFGTRICKGVVHQGFIVFDIDKKGRYSWWPELLRLESQKVLVKKL